MSQKEILTGLVVVALVAVSPTPGTDGARAQNGETGGETRGDEGGNWILRLFRGALEAPPPTGAGRPPQDEDRDRDDRDGDDDSDDD